VENARYARVFHSRQWSNYNLLHDGMTYFLGPCLPLCLECYNGR